MKTNKVEDIDISLIDVFENHPFKVVEDISFLELKQSIKNNGLLNPVIVRKKDDDRYEMISGHRRLLAMKQNGDKTIQAIVKELSKDQAIIDMVDSNLQRELILPSEKAFAYKMKLEAMKHQGKKVDTLDPEGPKLNSTEKIGLEFGASATNVKRYIRLTYLIPELLDYVDKTAINKNEILTIGIKPAVELSFLSKDSQQLVADAIDYNQATPSYAQAMQIRKLEENGELTDDLLDEILSEEKGNQHEQISFNRKKIEQVLPQELLRKDKRYIEQYIIKALENYSKEKNIERGDAYDLDA
ncbi:MAG: ParB/RepB/Spo0J family partition protein [Bacilli bacterium]